MMLDWQTTISLLIVMGAAVFVARRIWMWGHRTEQSGCGACPNKGMPPVVKTLPLVQIQLRQPPHKTNR